MGKHGRLLPHCRTRICSCTAPAVDEHSPERPSTHEHDETCFYGSQVKQRFQDNEDMSLQPQQPGIPFRYPGLG